MIQLVPLHQAMADAGRRYAEYVDGFTAWASARDVESVDRDVIAAICEAHVDFSGQSMGLWSRIDVRTLMSCNMFNVCTFANCSYPDGVPRALWAFIDFLADTKQLDEASDPIWELRKPLICYGGLGFDGTERAEGFYSPIPCECFMPYRATIDYLHRLFDNGTLVPDVLVWN